ncbi:MAG: glutamate--tRNA ligase [Propioniciclava sp.]
MSDDSQTSPRLRIAPSPTGDPHVGTAYMALFNRAFASQAGGQFVLRIEDTDRARYVPESEGQIFDTLRWLGLPWDEGPDIGGPYAPYRQSERLGTYQPFVEQLLEQGHAYYCWCTSERLAEMRAEQQAAKQAKTGYDRRCHGLSREERAALPGFAETPVVRMLVPEDIDTTFTDLIRGEIHAPVPDDQVILKADGFPTYHLAVVVDDHLMGITHVVRGEEWISSTPKHNQLYRWLGWPVPAYAHMPLLRNPDKSKISKRKNPAARLLWFREQGFLPEALRNFLQLLGYPPVRDDEEVASFEEFTAAFDWAKVNTVGPVFDLDKLTWLNGHYLRSLSPDELAERILEHLVFTGTWVDPSPAQVAALRRGAPLIQERLTVLSEAADKLAFLFIGDSDLVIDPAAAGALPQNTAEILDAAVTALTALPSWEAAAIESALRSGLIDGLGLKPRVAFAPVRIALTGSKVSPPLFESLEALGQESSLTRLTALRSHR